jgi:hypothetical protein
VVINRGLAGDRQSQCGATGERDETGGDSAHEQLLTIQHESAKS